MSATTLLKRLQSVLPTAKETGKLLPSLSPAESTNSQRQLQVLKEKEVLTLNEAAQYLRVDPQVLLAEAIKGSIPGFQLGGEWRFSATALAGAMSGEQATKTTEISSIFNDNLFPDHLSEELLRQIEFDITPPRTWEYYSAWMICIEIRRLAIDLQEKMFSGVLLHDLVTASTLDRLAEKWSELWQQTYYKDEDLQYRNFYEVWQWHKKAECYYADYKVFLGTRVTREKAEYKLTFIGRQSGEMVLQSDTLPVQVSWSPMEIFWKDSRRYDYLSSRDSHT
ncbi:helix-turn-helix domain-containing protein [Acaryochloris marina NIES-2412]|uniref:helix-turn-helix domain-containing protein n=1 Tax=Acaryochloris marina TaxID=155978 RepID=UPI0040589ED5